MSKHPTHVETRNEEATDYDIRNKSRWVALSDGTMTLKQHFVDLGDDETTALTKVTQVSRAVSTSKPEAKIDYIMGDTQPLKDEIQSVDEVTYPWFDQAAKDAIINVL